MIPETKEKEAGGLYILLQKENRILLLYSVLFCHTIVIQ